MKVGDHVVYAHDGTKGTIVEVEGNLCHVIWEDHFSSWEHEERLIVQEAYP
ncbi:hypothetical protein ACFPPD_15985 [Cohnella suwonensis]|uniref:DUF2158 domain-containing protein n=1 Tax=Cohnella suwonensis TaxID=696072 RepID=A0ABW0M054_9BACL